jgi:hypothetical protein
MAPASIDGRGMYYFGIALVVLALAVLGVNAFVRANPAALARNLRQVGALGLVAVSVILAVRGHFHAAFVLAGIAGALFLRGGAGFGTKSAGQRSQVRTATLEMELDHDTGAMRGRVLSGPLAGSRLEDLSIADLVSLHDTCARSDPQATALIEAYLDRVEPNWRETGEASGTSGGAKSGQGSAPGLLRMSAEEARQVLGVGADATEDQIRQAWREAMKRNHPDQGGSTFLAAKINEARDVLLGGS